LSTAIIVPTVARGGRLLPLAIVDSGHFKNQVNKTVITIIAPIPIGCFSVHQTHHREAAPDTCFFRFFTRQSRPPTSRLNGWCRREKHQDRLWTNHSPLSSH
jgi:hypothetical protein